MNIGRRDFIKMLGAFGGAMVAEGLAPTGIVKPADIMLPNKPTVVGPMPRMGGGLSEFIEIDLQSFVITVENPQVESLGIDSLLTYSDAPQYFTISLTIVADKMTTSAVDGWAAEKMYGRGGILRLPRRQGEWLCIYCGSVQPMIRTHCSQCGGARDWVVT